MFGTGHQIDVGMEGRGIEPRRPGCESQTGRPNAPLPTVSPPFSVSAEDGGALLSLSPIIPR